MSVWHMHTCLAIMFITHVSAVCFAITDKRFFNATTIITGEFTLYSLGVKYQTLYLMQPLCNGMILTDSVCTISFVAVVPTFVISITDQHIQDTLTILTGELITF